MMYSVKRLEHEGKTFGILQDMLAKKELADVTFACEGERLAAHKIVLSCCSPVFRKFLMKHPYRHLLIAIMDVELDDLRSLIDLMYKGSVILPSISRYSNFAHVIQQLEMTDCAWTASVKEEAWESVDGSAIQTGSTPAPGLSSGSADAFGCITTNGSSSPLTAMLLTSRSDSRELRVVFTDNPPEFVKNFGPLCQKAFGDLISTPLPTTDKPECLEARPPGISEPPNKPTTAEGLVIPGCEQYSQTGIYLTGQGVAPGRSFLRKEDFASEVKREPASPKSDDVPVTHTLSPTVSPLIPATSRQGDGIQSLMQWTDSKQRDLHRSERPLPMFAAHPSGTIGTGTNVRVIAGQGNHEGVRNRQPKRKTPPPTEDDVTSHISRVPVVQIHSSNSPQPIPIGYNVNYPNAVADESTFYNCIYCRVSFRGMAAFQSHVALYHYNSFPLSMYRF